MTQITIDRQKFFSRTKKDDKQEQDVRSTIIKKIFNFKILIENYEFDVNIINILFKVQNHQKSKQNR